MTRPSDALHNAASRIDYAITPPPPGMDSVTLAILQETRDAARAAAIEAARKGEGGPAMRVSMMSDYWLRREIASIADELSDVLGDKTPELVEFWFAQSVMQTAMLWHYDTPPATIEADCALITAVIGRYSDPETRTGRMWNEIGLLAREIAARAAAIEAARQERENPR